MRVLTPQTLAEAMISCSENSHYKAIIVFDNRNELREAVAELREREGIPNVERMNLIREDYFRINFKNRSVLEFITATESNIRGKRSNQVIVSEALEEDVLSEIEHMTVPYRNQFHGFFEYDWVNARRVLFNGELLSESDDEASPELDEFLNSFAVNAKCT